MLSIKFNSRQVEMTEDGIVTTICWTGKQDEIESFSREIGPGAIEESGTLNSVRVYPESPKIWVCERKFLRDTSGEAIERPNTVYGRKSAQLHGSMLSMPLEAHPNYRTRWNYYLASAPDVNYSPDWYLTATDPVLSQADAQKFAWIKSPSETPVDSKGRWNIIMSPEFPGVNSYDVAVYTITETAKYKSAKAAGQAVQKCLNKIGFPNETFGNTGGNWKCDDATVSYNGGAWYATMTWTRSGDDDGWNTDLYGGLS